MSSSEVSWTPDIRETVLSIGVPIQVVLVALRLDTAGGVDWNWFRVFIPTWVTFGLLIYLNVIIALRMHSARLNTPAQAIWLEKLPTLICFFFFFYLLVRRIQGAEDEPEGTHDSFMVVLSPLLTWVSVGILYTLAKIASTR